MSNNFKRAIDRMEWVQVTPSPNTHSSGLGFSSDLRSDASRNPMVYQQASPSILNRYNIITKAFGFAASPAMSGAVNSGAFTAFLPSLGQVGYLQAGSTSSKINLGPLSQAVGSNMLANRGGSGDFGYKIRVIDYVAGKTEERWITANTAGSSPSVWVDSEFTFTPAAGSRFEILAGRVLMVTAGTPSASLVKTLDVATNAVLAMGFAGLPTIGTDSEVLVLDEQYTPYDHHPGEGMVRGSYVYDSGSVSTRHALVATGASSNTLVGQASAGDATVVANEYRNFQIRIVEDTVNPSAVGQRNFIASHTAGPSATYTMGLPWAVTPSSSAKYVIELPNLLVARLSTTTATYVFNYSDSAMSNGTTPLAMGSWSSTYFTAAPAANVAGGQWAPSWGIQPDEGKNARHSYCYFFRGGGIPTLDVLDIAGGSSGAWTAGVTYDGGVNVGTGSCSAYSPFGNEGRMTYMNIYTSGQLHQIHRFDSKNRVLSPYTPTDYIQTGTAQPGARMAAYCAIDGDDLYDVILLQAHTSNILQELIPLV